MKKVFCLLLVVTGCISALCGCSQNTPEAEVGPQLLRDFSAVDIEGNIVDETVLSGRKLTMINVWATYCGPCIEEMPALGELHSAWGDDFQVIGIVVDAADKNLTETKEKAIEIIEQSGASYLHLLPSASLKSGILADITAVPTTYFVDETGNQVGDVYFGSKTKSQWKKIISDLLENM